MKKQILLVAFGILFLSITAFSQTKEVGVFYSNWFSYPTNWPNTGGCTWAEPALGWYESANNAVIDQHTEWLVASGIDFVCFDWSNNCDNSGSNIQDIENNSEAFAARQVWRKQNGYKTIKYCVFIGTCGNCNNVSNGVVATEASRVQSKFLNDPNRAALYWNLNGKPFLGLFCLTCETQGASYTNPVFTFRPMTGSKSGNRGIFWAWEEKSPTEAGYSTYNGNKEAMTVEPAYRGTGCAPNVVPQYPNGLPGWLNDGTVFGNKTIPRNSGQTFRDALDFALNSGVPIIIVQAFNQWTGCTANPGENMDQERSTDIEPMLGGHGNLYMTILKEYVEKFKGISLSDTSQTPFNGPHNIPGTIETEDFDNGGEGVAYYDTDLTNNGGQYRPNEGVDIENCSEGGYDVGWTNTGEWLEYTVNVTATNNYRMDIRYSSSDGNEKIHVEFDGVDKTGILIPASSSGLQTWKTISKNMTLTVGKHIMRLFFDQSGGALNINKFIFTAIGGNVTGAGDGLTGNYFQDSYAFNVTNWKQSLTENAAWNPPTTNISWFTTPIATRVDTIINIPKGNLSKFLSGIPNLNAQSPVSIRWTGFIEFLAAGKYNFYLSGADGLRVKINNKNIIGTFAQSDSSWVVRPYLDAGTSYLPLTGNITISASEANTRKPIVLEYFSVGVTNWSALADRGIKLEWENTSAGITRAIVPRSQLYSTNVSTEIINPLIKEKKQITIYPVPAKDKLFLENDNLIITEIEIFDLNGRIIYQSNEVFNQTKTVDISELQAGLYFIKFINEKNNIIKKFIKQ